MGSPLTHLSRAIKDARHGILARPLVHGLALCVLTVSLFASALSFEASRFTSRFFESWGSQAQLTAYLTSEATEADAQALAGKIRDSGLGDVTAVSPDEALERLRAELKDDADVVANLPRNPLLWSVEVRPAERYFSADALEPAAETIRAEPMVESVDYGREWFDKFSGLSAAFRRAALAILVSSLIAAVGVSALSLRLTAATRREEIALLRTLGATEATVRAPFILEGAALGCVASLLAFAGFAALDAWLMPGLASHLAFLLGGQPLPVLADAVHLATLAAAGIAAGVASSAFSVPGEGRG